MESYKKDHVLAGDCQETLQISVTTGQLEYEWAHLLRKVSLRNPDLYPLMKTQEPIAHPIFRIISGGIENWEVVQ